MFVSCLKISHNTRYIYCLDFFRSFFVLKEDSTTSTRHRRDLQSILLLLLLRLLQERGSKEKGRGCFCRLIRPYCELCDCIIMVLTVRSRQHWDVKCKCLQNQTTNERKNDVVRDGPSCDILTTQPAIVCACMMLMMMMNSTHTL
jgi:hypothetical protein